MTLAFQHLYFSPQAEYGSKLRAALTSFEGGLKALVDARDTMTFMLSGDGSSASHFAEVAVRFGFSVTGGDAAANNEVAQAAYNEINSYLGKELSNGSVTVVHDAREQMLDKLR